jgi:hypothetical protein
MELKDTSDQKRGYWMTIGTAVALVVAAALLIFVLLPQATSNDLSADGGSTAASRPTLSD